VNIAYRGHRVYFCLYVALFCAPRLPAQTVNPTPASIQDLAGQFPVSEKFNLELQIQTGTQSNSNNDNPFAY
jgi:hypothetical protein